LVVAAFGLIRSRQAGVLLFVLTFVALQDTVSLVPIVVKGSERLAWDQPADHGVRAATYSFIAYVDGEIAELQGQSCRRSSPEAVFSCSAPLPPLSVGTHTIHIVRATARRSALIGRSNTLRVLVVRPAEVRDAAVASDRRQVDSSRQR
jgi:hypothetical protein